MDFSVSGVSGQITYDLNGNLLTMLQKGVIAGGSSPITLDDLRYNYAPLKNKLESVTDQMTVTASNGQSGDFKDGANGVNPDYVYDDNGNVVIDLNKNAQSLNNGAPGTNGIKYNHLDKPEEIRIVGKGTIKIVYSADGEKLQRIYTPETGSVSITSYANAFEYKSIDGNSDALKYIRFEEGRIRVIQPTSETNGYDAFNVAGNLTLPNGKEGAYDYFILDYQSNVRMVVTEQQQSASNIATMETARSGQESPVFGQTGPANELEASRFATPSAWNNATVGQQVSRLGTLSGHTLGPNTLQKVMAGDKISATVQYFYQATPGASSPISTVVLNTLGQLLSGTSSVSSIVKSNATAITAQLGANPGFIDAVQPTGGAGNIPEAYLTILFFDERFNFISAADGGVMQQQVAASVSEGGSTLGLGSIKAPKNGYAMVYLSNRSDQPVYFDNLQVGKVAGNILEENHYYAYGLRIAAISSRKFGDVSEGEIGNNFQYQGEFSEIDEDLGWTEFDLRNYDSQIGRFVQADPFGQFASPYTGMGNDPINIIDPSGGIGIPCPGTSALGVFFMKVGEFIGNGLSALSNISPLLGIGTNTANIGAGIYNRSVQFSIINRQLVSNMVKQVGDGKNDPNYWILYNGTEVNIYEGEYENTDNLVKSFEGTSGIYTTSDPEGTKIINDYRNSKYQFTQDDVIEDGVKKKIFVGPLPEGNYNIDLSLDPNRQAMLGSNGETIPGKGMEKITYFKDGKEYVRYPSWESRRAKLDADPDTKKKLGGRDGNFYFHNSHKGYTHGCVETKLGLFDFLRSIRSTQSTIKVKIKYKSKNTSTNGNTKS